MAEQEREVNIIRGPDKLNPQMHSPMRPEPSIERLSASHSRVMVTNTSSNQNHIVIDRFNVGHELRPGERREMVMLNDEIANFQEQRRPDRFYPETDRDDPPKAKPLHPIVIEGVPDMVDEVRAAQETQAREAMRRRQEEAASTGKSRRG
jgi:hypothetical protein